MILVPLRAAQARSPATMLSRQDGHFNDSRLDDCATRSSPYPQNIVSSDDGMAKSNSLPRYRSNLQGEVDGVAIYTALADSEADPKLAEVFRRLAAVEQAHGDFWRKQ